MRCSVTPAPVLVILIYMFENDKNAYVRTTMLILANVETMSYSIFSTGFSGFRPDPLKAK